MEPHEVVADFLVQAHDQLDRLELELIGIEREPHPSALVYRAAELARNLALASSTLGFARLTSLVEAAEALLLAVGRGGVASSATVVDALLTGADAARSVLDAIDATGSEDGCDVSGALAGMDALAVAPDRPPPAALGEVLVESGMATDAAVSLARHAQEVGDPRPLGEILLAHGSLTGRQLAAGLEAQNDRRALLDRTLRVDAPLLDELLALSEALANRRDEVLSWAADLPPGPLREALDRLDGAVEDVRAGVRRTRLRRLADACDRLPRLVRDLAAATGKVVNLQTVDADLELPRPLLAVLREPLALLVRNAVDHGIEAPAARRFASKGVSGTVRLRASLTEDRLAVEVSDDGAGIDPLAVRGAALARGVLSAYDLARLTDEDVLRLLLLPGLALPMIGPDPGPELCTGPGMGLARLLSTVTAVGGEVTIWSQVGIGTTVRFTVPLAGPPAPDPAVVEHARS